tara:strand:+ start:950 stop:1477 length:528 start_codon:yes stop_codon:yes gene_type:complete
MKSLFLAMVLVFGLFLQVNDAEAKRYRAVKSKKSYSYSKPVRPVKKAEPVKETQKPQAQEAQQVQQPQQQYQDNSLRNTVVGAATGAVVGAATGTVVSHMLNSDDESAPADATEADQCDPAVQDCQALTAPSQEVQEPAISNTDDLSKPVEFDWIHAVLGLGLIAILVMFLKNRK